jgi:hypothetical protein
LRRCNNPLAAHCVAVVRANAAEIAAPRIAPQQATPEFPSGLRRNLFGHAPKKRL